MRIKTLHYSIRRRVVPLLTVLVVGGYSMGESGPLLLAAQTPMHLEDHLDAAKVVGPDVPADLPAVEWRFDEPQPDWKPVATLNPHTKPAKVERTDDALRLTLDESNHTPGGSPVGGIVIDLPQWSGEDWDSILVRARSSEGIGSFQVAFNTSSDAPSTTRWPRPYALFNEWAPTVNDGTVQTYLFHAPRGTWNRLGLWVLAGKPATFEVLSVSVVFEQDYADAPAGKISVWFGNVNRQAIYSVAPGRIDYRVVVPRGGRLAFGLGVLQGVPATFRIAATPDGGDRQVLLEHVYAGEGDWDDHSVDLSLWQGQTVTLSLEAEAERPGTVVFFLAPTLSATPGRVLFLGNSYLYHAGGIYQPFEGFCAAAGLDCEAVWQGGPGLHLRSTTGSRPSA